MTALSFTAGRQAADAPFKCHKSALNHNLVSLQPLLSQEEKEMLGTNYSP